VPTRELAAQVGESFRGYGRHLDVSVAVIYGGIGQGPQVRALERGVDVVVATPGRLVDLMGQGHARLGQVEMLVLDEADHMLDLGFIPDVRRILAQIPRQRQTLLFSATMPPPIAQLAHGILVHPAKVIVTPEASTVDTVDQRVHFVLRQEKPALLASLLRDPAVGRALVFTRTKHGANRLARWLVNSDIPSEAIHGNKSQTARERTLHGFKGGRVRVLVATDLAARGIDVDDITHVFNFELPNVPETYVHRIGRTARAGARGIAISLCEPEVRPFPRDIEKLIKHTVRVASSSRHAGRAEEREARDHREPARAHAPPTHAHGQPAHAHAQHAHARAQPAHANARAHAPDADSSARRPRPDSERPPAHDPRRQRRRWRGHGASHGGAHGNSRGSSHGGAHSGGHGGSHSGGHGGSHGHGASHGSHGGSHGQGRGRGHRSHRGGR